MGHLQEMNDKQRSEFQSYQYKRMLEERRGHNYKYHSDELEESLKEKGYEWYDFGSGLEQTNFEDEAIEAVENLRETGHYARIICERMKVVQRVKYYSVAYKRKA